MKQNQEERNYADNFKATHSPQNQAASTPDKCKLKEDLTAHTYCKKCKETSSNHNRKYDQLSANAINCKYSSRLL
jgi:hypothetical protein